MLMNGQVKVGDSQATNLNMALSRKGSIIV